MRPSFVPHIKVERLGKKVTLFTTSELFEGPNIYSMVDLEYSSSIKFEFFFCNRYAKGFSSSFMVIMEVHLVRHISIPPSMLGL